ncbi:MAG: gliding motility lipoprotein GldH, partial [Hoylesella buccalis]
QYAFDITSMDLHEGDSLHISVRHDMKREILPGISNVGVSLTKR